jgi:dethiobiotin synthetase
MRQRRIPVFGVSFIGDAYPDTQRIIEEMGDVRVLGRLRRLEPLTPDTLRQAFRENFDTSSFREVIA